jgi:hypothetical protein
LSQAVWAYSHAEAPEGFTFPSWEAAFGALGDLPDRPIVILDEFTYLISGNKALPSILQKVWDRSLRHTHVMLILCGSYMGMMEREVLGYQAALYGRRTGTVLLESLSLSASAAFFPAYGPLQQIEAWAVLGGMPCGPSPGSPATWRMWPERRAYGSCVLRSWSEVRLARPELSLRAPVWRAARKEKKGYSSRPYDMAGAPWAEGAIRLQPVQSRLHGVHHTVAAFRDWRGVLGDRSPRTTAWSCPLPGPLGSISGGTPCVCTSALWLWRLLSVL